jgi:hypothetical protein
MYVVRDVSKLAAGERQRIDWAWREENDDERPKGE